MKFLKKSCGLNHYLNTHQFIYLFLKKGKHDGEKSFNWCGKILELSAKMTVKLCPWVGDTGKLLHT
jgi:hypothetical protein